MNSQLNAEVQKVREEELAKQKKLMSNFAAREKKIKEHYKDQLGSMKKELLVRSKKIVALEEVRCTCICLL